MKTLKERLLEKIYKTNDCWIWTASKSNGYGYMRIENGKLKKAASISYELWIGKVPYGLVLDHICHNKDKDCRGGINCVHRACVNPYHLEPVSHEVNILRGKGIAANNHKKMFCINGHYLAGDNLHMQKDKRGKSWRKCKECGRIKMREYRERKKIEPLRS